MIIGAAVIKLRLTRLITEIQTIGLLPWLSGYFQVFFYFRLNIIGSKIAVFYLSRRPHNWHTPLFFNKKLGMPIHY